MVPSIEVTGFRTDRRAECKARECENSMISSRITAIAFGSIAKRTRSNSDDFRIGLHDLAARSGTSIEIYQKCGRQNGELLFVSAFCDSLTDGLFGAPHFCVSGSARKQWARRSLPLAHP
jgi:hypothetical protein